MPSSRASEEEQRRQQAAGDAPPERQEERPPDADAAEVEQLRARVGELEDRWKRALADLDNYRKRAARDVDRRVAEEREALLLEWLDAIDVVERGLQVAAPAGDAAGLYRGLRALLEQLEATLQRHGVRRVGAAGERFDPELHEAVAVRETADVPPHTIVESARSGFAQGDRVLRPAQVVVSRPPEHRE